MSASDKKKLRKEEKLAQLTEKQRTQQKEAKQLKTNTIVFTVAIILVLALGIGIIGVNWFTSSGLAQRWTTAVVLGDHKVSVAELNYYYYDVINELTSDYVELISLRNNDGLDTSLPLDEQPYKGSKDMTWADFFINKAVEEAAGVYALCDAAEKEGFTLTDAEKKAIDTTITNLTSEAALYGYTLPDYLTAVYGKGASEKTYRQYLTNVTLAQSYMTHYSEGLSFTDAELEAFEKEKGSYSSFTYTYLQLNPDDFMEHPDGSSSHDHTEEEEAAALEETKKAAETLVASGATDKESLDAAAAQLPAFKVETTEGETTEDETAEGETTEDETTEGETTEGETAEGETTEDETAEGETTEDETAEGETTEDETAEDETTVNSNAPKGYVCNNYHYSTIPDTIAEWLNTEGRKEGDIGYVPYIVTDSDGKETVEGYFVVIYGSEERNETNLVTVRHILVEFEGGTSVEGTNVYSEEEKAAAKEKIDEIEKTYNEGEKTEDAFAALAKKHSADSNAEDGGLYEDVYPGWAVTNFNDWCFDEDRKSGDVEVVETEHGYHLIYFVEHQEQTYREYMITADLRTEKTDEWFSSLRNTYVDGATKKNFGLIQKDLVLNG